MSFISRLLIFGPLCLVLSVGCGSKVNPKGDFLPGGGGSGGTLPGIDGSAGEAATVPSFTYDVMPLLKKGCVCHVQGGQPPLLDTYANVTANAAVSLQSVKGGSMPPDGPLSSSDTDILQRWITAGTPNN